MISLNQTLWSSFTFSFVFVILLVLLWKQFGWGWERFCETPPNNYTKFCILKIQRRFVRAPRGNYTCIRGHRVKQSLKQ